MTEEKADAEPAPEIKTIQDEVAKQMKQVKDEFAKMASEKDAKIKELKEQNKQLNSAVIRSAILAPPVKEETEEEKYRKEVESLSKKTIEMMKYL